MYLINLECIQQVMHSNVYLQIVCLTTIETTVKTKGIRLFVTFNWWNKFKSDSKQEREEKLNCK